jgi:hypothetical protein
MMNLLSNLFSLNTLSIGQQDSGLADLLSRSLESSLGNTGNSGNLTEDLMELVCLNMLMSGHSSNISGNSNATANNIINNNNTGSQGFLQQLNSASTQLQPLSSTLTSIANGTETDKSLIAGTADVINGVFSNTDTHTTQSDKYVVSTVNGKKLVLGINISQASSFLKDAGASLSTSDLGLMTQEFPQLKLTSNTLSSWLNGEAFANSSLVSALKNIATLKSQATQQGIPSSNSSLQNLTNIGNQIVTFINNDIGYSHTL